MEDKVRTKSPYYLPIKTWKKIKEEARLVHKIPALRCTVGDQDALIVMFYEDWSEIGGSRITLFSAYTPIPRTFKITNDEPEEPYGRIWGKCTFVQIPWRLFEEVNDAYMEEL